MNLFKLNIFLIVVTALTLFSGCGSDNDNSAGGRGPKDGPRVLNSKPGLGFAMVFGDSIAEGVGSTSERTSLAGCLSEKLNQSVLNFGVRGETSEEIRRRVNQIQSYEPKLVIVSAGGNDVFHDMVSNDYPEKKTFAQVRSMYRELIKRGTLVVHIGFDSIPRREFGRLGQLNKIAREEGALVLSGVMGKLYKDPNRYITSDQIHPNDEGYAFLCSKIASALKGYYP